MVLLMDSKLWDGTKEVLFKLRENLPLTIATTIVMSLIVGFWKKLVRFVKQRIRPAKSLTGQQRPSLPEDNVARVYALDEFRGGFRVARGWHGAAVDAGMVQWRLGSGRYRRGAVSRMIARFQLGQNAKVITWRDGEFPLVLRLEDLFASDHQPMRLETRAVFRLNPEHLLQSGLEDAARPPGQIAAQISERIALPARQWVSSLEGAEAYRHRDRVAGWAELAEGWLKTSLDGSAFELVRVTDFNLHSPALDRLYRDYGELALENDQARGEIERNKVRGALRQAALAGKLEELRDRNRYEDTVRALAQERNLKEKALRQELAQAELNELEENVRLWKRKHEVLLRALDPVQGSPLPAAESALHLVENLRRSAVDAEDSPFSAHEREQIRTLLQSSRAQSAKPAEILVSISRGTDLPIGVFDPLARIRGAHTLHVGDGWRLFDGDCLWQIRLTRIDTERHGFLWCRESPSVASFEMRGSPDNRRFEQEIRLGEESRLNAGPHEIPVIYLGGTPSRISFRIPGPGDEE